MGGSRAGAIAALAAIFATGCLGVGDQRDDDRHHEQIDAVPATVPQYPGARLVDRHDRAASSELHYELAAAVTGSQVQLHFRRLLATRKWRCTFHAQLPYGFACRRGGQSLDAEIGERGGYELVVRAPAS